MSIVESFDNKSGAIINPEHIAKPLKNFPETVVVTFEEKCYNLMIKTDGAERIGSMHAGRIVPIHKILFNQKPIAFYHTIMGGATSAALLEEVIAKGGRKILFFGSCGSLDNTVTSGHLIIPTSAYRDEGVSYHYAPPSDYIEVKTANDLSQIFTELNIPHVKTKTWTTDGIYRETRNNMLARKSEGCLVVEMECASVMAVGDFRNVEVYQFLYAADSLSGENWNAGILTNMPQNLYEKHVRIAFEVASRL